MSFDASLEMYRGEDLALAVEGGRVLRGISSGIIGWGAGGGEGTSLQPLRKQDGGETLLGMTDSGTRQLHRTTFCALKQRAAVTTQPFIWRPDCRSMLLWKYLGGEDL